MQRQNGYMIALTNLSGLEISQLIENLKVVLFIALVHILHVAVTECVKVYKPLHNLTL